MTDLAKTGEYFDNNRGGYNKAHTDAYNASKIEELLQITDRFFPNI
ncbi:hypothetical protein [Maribacter sp. MAR_2009_72]|nr:hypothetical protein [Maribacter sp. MAR_2009_72]